MGSGAWFHPTSWRALGLRQAAQTGSLGQPHRRARSVKTWAPGSAVGSLRCVVGGVQLRAAVQVPTVPRRGLCPWPEGTQPGWLPPPPPLPSMCPSAWWSEAETLMPISSDPAVHRPSQCRGGPPGKGPASLPHLLPSQPPSQGPSLIPCCSSPAPRRFLKPDAQQGPSSWMGGVYLQAPRARRG